MRRVLVVMTVVAAMLLAFAPPTLAQTTVAFDALIHEEFDGASPFQPCPTGGADPCAVGRIARFGKATATFEFLDGEPVGSCFQATFATTFVLLNGSGTLEIVEVDTFCTPGSSSDTVGNQFHSFGNPFSIEGTWVVTGGTGIFTGATGSGTNTSQGGGDALIDMYEGTIELP